MITALDTNVLLDVLLEDTEFSESTRAVLTSKEAGLLIVSDPAFAELAGEFPDAASQARFFDDAGIVMQRSSPETLRLAGVAWREYRGRYKFECPRCGHRLSVRCESCGSAVQVRQHLLADFLIGAHALVHADRLLTRDRGYYRTYFPDLALA